MQNAETNQPPPLQTPQEGRAGKEELLKRIYSWASKNTSEARNLVDFKYHWPSAAIDLLRVLELSEGSIIVLAGLSGVGKSSAQAQVARALNEKFAQKKDAGASERKAVHFKWPGYLDSNYGQILKFLIEQSVRASDQELIALVADRLARSRDARVIARRMRELFGVNFEWNDTIEDRGIAAFSGKELKDLLLKGISGEGVSVTAEMMSEKLLGPNDLKFVQKELAVSLLSRCQSILIDLRDYGLRDSRAMNTDLTEIQKLWQQMNEYLYSKKASSPGSSISSPNLVFVLQKELAKTENAREANYFLGKVTRTFELAPFLSTELVQAYKEEFGSTYPFEEHGLRMLAVSSRGVFRRFLRYIQLCLDFRFQNMEKTGDDMLLKEDEVERALPKEEIASDWEVELRQIFPRGSYWKVAFYLMLAVTEAPLTQSELCEVIRIPDKSGREVSVSQSELSTVVRKLEDYGYVKRQNTSRGKLVSMNV